MLEYIQVKQDIKHERRLLSKAALCEATVDVT
jgi:hypothetical protein